MRVELGRRLRSHRTSQERTLASVAVDAGLSVPYVANLENGRGNPTLSALQGLARALGVPLAELVDERPADEGARAPLPASLAEFAGGSRFQREVRLAAAGAGSDASEVRRRFLTAMAAMAQLTGRLDELDLHRVLDVIVLLQRPR
ncbi:MAG TPA: helix-turn-helix transcriptional regulator [Candidatus Dormibacteraeota bacterium]